MEASKLQPITKDKERAQEANQKAQELAEAKSREAEKKLAEKMEAFEENKNAQMQAKLEKLKDHVSLMSPLSFTFKSVCNTSVFSKTFCHT